MAKKRKRKASTKTKATRPTRKRASAAVKPTRKKKPPTRGPSRVGGGATRAKGSEAKGSPKRAAPVKSIGKPPKPKPGAHVRKPLPKPKPKPKGKLSKHPEAARSRRRRGLARERERAAELKREAANRKRREQRERKKRPLSEADLARGWLEMIHARISEVFGCTLDITVPGGGAARDEDKEREAPAIAATGGTPWMIVGRYDPTEEIDYQILAAGLQHVADDIIIEAAVNPDRLSQIRIIFADPSGARSEADAVLSHIGSWSFILPDAIGDLVGSSIESPDEGSLAARYKETTVPCFYLFFSTEMVLYKTAPGFAPRTQEVKIKR